MINSLEEERIFVLFGVQIFISREGKITNPCQGNEFSFHRYACSSPTAVLGDFWPSCSSLKGL